MPDYAARIAELDRAVNEQREAALKVEADGGAPALLAGYIRLGAGIASYADVRDRALNDGLALLKPDSSATAESQQRRWADHFNAKGSEAIRVLNDLVSRDGDETQRRFELFAMQEGIAFSAINAMPLAGAVGTIAEHIRTLDEQCRTLQAKWRELSGLDERIDGQIAAVRVQVLETFKRGVNDIRSWTQKLEEDVRKVVDLWDRKEETDPEPSMSSTAKSFLDTLGTLQRTLDDAVRQSQPLYASEQTVHELFGKVRQQVQEYLEKVNKDTVGRAYADACRATQDCAGRSFSDGQRADGVRFAERAISATQSLMGDFNSAWDRFYGEFQGVFTGEVSDQTTEFLGDQEFFNQFWRDVEAIGLPAQIRSAGEALSRIEGLSLDRMTPQQKQMFEITIKARLKEIQERIRAMDSSVWERFKLMFVTTPMSMAKDRLKGLRGYRK